MMKLRKNLLVAMIAGLMAVTGVACDEGVQDDTDVDTTEPGLDDPLEDEPAVP